MIKKLVLLMAACFLSFSAQAAKKTSILSFERMALQDFNAVLSDTYNEGEGTAEAIEASCKVVRQIGTEGVIFCTLAIEVQPSRDSDYKSTVVCTSMGYKFDRRSPGLENFAGWEDCMDSVNDLTEN